MDVLYPPDMRYIPERSVFLCGSIEMGTAERWQDEILKNLEDSDLTVCNPRRRDWNSDWEQSKKHTNFRKQVVWELSCLDSCTMVAVYFDPNTKSPITLLELGLYSNTYDKELVVCCPEGYWRRGNVDIVCEYYNIPQVENLDNLISYIKEWYNV